MDNQQDYLAEFCKLVKESSDKAVYISDPDKIGWIKHSESRLVLRENGIRVGIGRVPGEFMFYDSSLSEKTLDEFRVKTGARKPTGGQSHEPTRVVSCNEPKRELFVCDCGDINHQFVVTVNENQGDKDVFLEVRLNRYLSFWGRLINAIRYLFKLSPPCRFGDYDCIILNKSHIDGLERIVRELKTLKD